MFRLGHSVVCVLAVFICVTISSSSWGETNLKTKFVFTAVNDPWSIAWLPSGEMLVTEKSGKLFLVDPGEKYTEVSGIPDVHRNGQGGLLDVQVHPDYAQNGWIYLSYSSTQGAGQGSNTAIVRGHLKNDAWVDQELLYKAKPNSGRGQHYGGRMVLDKEGYLYFSVGDRGNRSENPQDLSRDGGKIYRLKDNGDVPADNPFVSMAGAIPAIFSFGHRNPQGLALHPVTGAIWEHEHGPRGGDEINLIKAGANYGWPLLSFGINYDGTPFAQAQQREGYESPLTYWDPSIAPSGMAFVTSERYPEIKGHLLVGSLKFGYIELCRLEGDRVVAREPLLKGVGRVRDIKQGPDGYLYAAITGKGIVQVLPKE